MIRINWREVEDTRTRLLRDGATDSLEMVVLFLYHNKSDCDKVQIQLGQLQKSLFELSSNEFIKGIFLYDLAVKKPYLKCEEPDRVSIVEAVPSSGHPNVIAEFGKMSPEAKDVWLEIAMSQQQHYVSEGA
ncbi:MAG: hypothetical protein V3T23_03050 [Nitrososphaerales archaeon]